MPNLVENVKTFAGKKVAGIPIWGIAAGAAAAVIIWTRLHPSHPARQVATSALAGMGLPILGAGPPQGATGPPPSGPIGGGGGIGPPPSVPTGPSMADIINWLKTNGTPAQDLSAAAINVQKFVSTFGRLPSSQTEVQQWAIKTGIWSPQPAAAPSASTGGAPAPAAPTPTAPTLAQIQQWASGIGLSTALGQRYVQQFGVLPNNLQSFVQWGNTSGLRNPSTGAWSL